MEITGNNALVPLVKVTVVPSVEMIVVSIVETTGVPSVTLQRVSSSLSFHATCHTIAT